MTGPQKHPTIRNPSCHSRVFPSFHVVVPKWMPIIQVREGHWQAHAYTNEGLESCGKIVKKWPMCSMYGILTYIWLKFMVNVGKYSLHGASRWCCKENNRGCWWKHHADSWDVCSLLSSSIFFKNHVVYCDDCVLMYCISLATLPKTSKM